MKLLILGKMQPFFKRLNDFVRDAARADCDQGRAVVARFPGERRDF